MGSGKSTLGNMLIEGSSDDGPFETSSSFDNVTKVCKEGTVTIEGNQYTIVDTPGIFDNNSPPDKKILEIMSYILTRCARGIKAIICVLEATRFSPEHEQILKLLQTAFANGDLNNYVIAVFSKPTKEQMIEPNKMQQDWNTTFTTFIESIGYRWGISPHSDIYAPDTEVHQNLLMGIKRLIINTPGVYTDKKFAETRKGFDDAQRQKNADLDKAKKEYEKNSGQNGAKEAYDLKIQQIDLEYQNKLKYFLFAGVAIGAVGAVLMIIICYIGGVPSVLSLLKSFKYFAKKN